MINAVWFFLGALPMTNFKLSGGSTVPERAHLNAMFCLLSFDSSIQEGYIIIQYREYISKKYRCLI